jgi:alkylation response protein AidB-like acyl-CoA dehydrogenase
MSLDSAITRPDDEAQFVFAHAFMGPLAGAIERLYLVSVSRTIAAGTSEIQRNIIAERGPGLPVRHAHWRAYP